MCTESPGDLAKDPAFCILTSFLERRTGTFRKEAFLPPAIVSGVRKPGSETLSLYQDTQSPSQNEGSFPCRNLPCTFLLSPD